MKTICNFCGHKNFTKKKVPYILQKNGNFLMVNNVPCEECEYCGEQFFKAETLKKIEKEFNNIYVNGKKARLEIKVPVEEFPEI